MLNRFLKSILFCCFFFDFRKTGAKIKTNNYEKSYFNFFSGRYGMVV
jgi:hypothetical protein